MKGNKKYNQNNFIGNSNLISFMFNWHPLQFISVVRSIPHCRYGKATVCNRCTTSFGNFKLLYFAFRLAPVLVHPPSSAIVSVIPSIVADIYKKFPVSNIYKPRY
ncbi:hypothetical protein BpHYR1_026369 [Brachionus plicatilis]|uniref:Uncharacterized protein n=1 Tax=Brachionus plicatilis TaxID=10195 RepID=A0A3M7SDH5_BRAPC|nr:hypothetical protein BpHYR1_026369 [Brachionus plicatilis]